MVLHRPSCLPPGSVSRARYFVAPVLDFQVIRAVPAWLAWLGLVVGTAGILSTVPGLAGLAVIFGLLVIVWFAGLGVALLREAPAAVPGPPLVGSRS